MFAAVQILFADKTAVPASWGLLLFCIVLGVIISLTPSRRTSEIKPPKDE